MKLELKFVPFSRSPKNPNLIPPPPCPRVHLPGLFFPSCPIRYLANPRHCQDLNAAFSACHIFSIQHFSIISRSPTDKERERERQRERGRNWRRDKETHSMDYTPHTHTHKYAYAQAGTYCMNLCLISPAVYQGDQEFNTVKFPVDKTLFREVGSNECCSSTEGEEAAGEEEEGEGGGGSEGDERRMTRGRFGLIAYLILSFPPLSSCSHLLRQMRKLDLTQKCFYFICRERTAMTLNSDGDIQQCNTQR